MSSTWLDYIDAAHRKIAIASFHSEQLKDFLCRFCDSFDSPPAIPIQAYFEGTVIATVSAIDQVAQAVNSALCLHLPPNELFDGASREIETRVPSFRTWREQPIGLDLRRLRTRIIHYSYTKSSDGNSQWSVEIANESYAGRRDLASYADAAAAYGCELGVIADELKELLLAEDTEA